MSEHDAMAGDGRADRSLVVALTDLADSMPDDPYRVDGIHAKARRLRTRRRATRATVGVVAGAAVITTLAAVRPGPLHVSPVPASQPSTTTAMPSCDAALAAASTQVGVPPTRGAEASTAADAAKQAASDNADAANQAATGFRGIKGMGTIVSATDSTVTITPDPHMPDQPSEITATVSPTAEFYDGETKVDARPSLSPGDRVAFGSTEAADGSYQLIFLAVHVPERPAPTANAVDPTAKAANAVASDPYVKGMAEVVSVQPDSLTVRFTDGERTDQVLMAALGPDTMYTVGDQKCVDPVLTAGQDVAVLLVHDESGAYTAEAVVLFRPPAPRAATP